MSTFGIYIIGDEILSGKREDKHLHQAIAILQARGLTLSWARYLGDDPTLLTSSFKNSFASNDIVFSFGGIGATPDDLTRQAAADALGLPIKRHTDAVAEIEVQFGAEAYPKRVLMADFPLGSALIPNPVNRCSGFAIHQHYFLPGFPQMAWPMMEWVLDTHYQQLFNTQVSSEVSIKVFDVPESQLIDLMQVIVHKYPTLKLYSLPSLSPNKTIELGLKGELKTCKQAMAEIQLHLDAHQMKWQKLENQ
jgi:molybdopterin-biosynthesis enzyme MoeA-like protein